MLTRPIIGLEIDRPQMRETTALGAAIAAGFAVDVWKEFSELKGINRDNRSTFWPNTTKASREKLYSNWQRAVERSRGWVDNDRVDDDDE
jgi:glycerol kinase